MSAGMPVIRRAGQFARRLREVEAIPSGMRATVELIDFLDVGDERKPVIVSAEPLSRQAIFTNVPNRPAEVVEETADLTETAILEIQQLAPAILRVRMGSPEWLERPRDFGMLVDDAPLDPMTAETPQLRDDATATQGGGADMSSARQAGMPAPPVICDLGGHVLRIARDPFALRIGDLATPNDDRNVHGLLTTPLPGFVGGERGMEALWSWALTPDERIYGLGERFTPLDHRGERLTLWNGDAWGTTTDATYKNIPFLHSSRGYGLFFHTPAPVTLALGSPSRRSASAMIGEPGLDLFVIFAPTPKDMLYAYTRLTGRAPLPPRWAFGVWLSRCRYQSRVEVEAVAARARSEDVPCDVLHIDPAWLERPGLNCDFISNEEAFPDLPGMVRELGEQGFKISLWELPYISTDSPRYAEGIATGYFLRDEQGNPIAADFGGPTPDGKPRAIVDFTNPAARAWWQDLHRPYLRAGVAVFKTDFGEGVPSAARAFNGMTGYELHNLYPLLYNAAVAEVIAQETGRAGLVWGRSGWAGSQRHPAQWGGDPKTDVWSMAASLRGGLNLALSAPGLWAHDIGGFYGPPPSPELYTRWAQFGLLSPLARAHGTTPREPWEFGAEALAIFRRYAKLRTRLHPYLYTLAWEAHERGLPMLRPLMLEYPDDPVAVTIDDEYLLGSDLLIAPIFDDSRDPVQRRIYLPGDEWYDFWNDRWLAGGYYITYTAPLDMLPLFVRAGAILPLGPECASIGDTIPDDITLEAYGDFPEGSALFWSEDEPPTLFSMGMREKKWSLVISGQHEASWHVRWHTSERISEHDPIRCASATLEL